MKRSKKCYGLLLALSIMFGLSLNIFLEDTSAYRYSINSFDLSGDTLEFRLLENINTNEEYYTLFSRLHTFSISILNDSVPNGFRFPHNYNFSGQYDSSTNSCSIPAFNDSFYRDGVESRSYYSSISYYPDLPLGINYWYASRLFDWSTSIPIFSQGDNILCSLYGYRYNTIDEGNANVDRYAPFWDWSSLINIPLVNDRLAYEAAKPYFYSYDRLYLNATDTHNGTAFERTGLKMSEIFNTEVHNFTELEFSFTLFDDVLNQITSTDDVYCDGYVSGFDPSIQGCEDVYNFHITGDIVFDSDYSFNSNSNGGVQLFISNFYNPYFTPDSSPSIFDYYNDEPIYYLSSYDSIIDCSYDEYHISSGDSENKVSFVCSYNPTVNGGYYEKINFSFMDIRLRFSGNISAPYTEDIVQTNGDYTFTNFSIITNNNSTENPLDTSATSHGTGGNTESAPGNDTNDPGWSENFVESLQNLFNFSFINPFAPLFSLFTGSNSCVQIPIIAGMLHSEDSTYCPWFSESTRSILTPVIGLSASMLIFGFLVRWLGSSSGNLFEDSSNEEVSNQGGRWGHFKKGGN